MRGVCLLLHHRRWDLPRLAPLGLFQRQKLSPSLLGGPSSSNTRPCAHSTALSRPVAGHSVRTSREDRATLSLFPWHLSGWFTTENHHQNSKNLRNPMGWLGWVLDGTSLARSQFSESYQSSIFAEFTLCWFTRMLLFSGTGRNTQTFEQRYQTGTQTVEVTLRSCNFHCCHVRKPNNPFQWGWTQGENLLFIYRESPFYDSFYL